MKKVLLPHPVLLPTGTDYTNECKFDMETGKAQYTIDDNILIPLKLILKSPFINNLISKKKAKLTILVKCPKTHKRRNIDIDNMEEKLSLPLSDYVDKIILSPYITSTESIEPFKSSEHHDELSGMTIGVPAGAILARGSDAELTIDSLQTLSAAIQLLTDNKLKNEEYVFDVSDDYIKIYLNDKMRKNVEMVRKSQSSKLYPSLYLAVITYAIQNIEENSNRKWAEALTNTLSTHKIKLNDRLKEDAYKHAQLLLKYPLKHIMEAKYTDD